MVGLALHITLVSCPYFIPPDPGCSDSGEPDTIFLCPGVGVHTGCWLPGHGSGKSVLSTHYPDNLSLWWDVSFRPQAFSAAVLSLAGATGSLGEASPMDSLETGRVLLSRVLAGA